MIAAAGALLALVLPAHAGAATPIGATFIPGSSCEIPSETFLQSTSPGGLYTVPSPGVITSWSWGAGAIAPSSVKLKLGRPAGGASFTIVAESGPESGPAPGTVGTYSARVPVQGGELLGVHLAGGYCARPMGGYTLQIVAGDQAPGTTTAYLAAGPNQIPVAAQLEADDDGDGFGDETQDECPADPSKQDCTLPDTTITKGPKGKTRKKKTIFEFSSNEAVASFECSLDDQAFSPCVSGESFKVKTGKHKFVVQAIDAAGNRDGSPASDKWKVKKKKKR